MRDYITRPGDLLDQIWKDRDVNIVDKGYTLGGRKFNLIDISLNGHGQDQDKKYIRSVFYRKNIRKGNTIIQGQKNSYCQLARKGTPKILEIRLEHIQYFMKKKELGKAERNLAQIIFEGVNVAFQEGKKVELIKSQKLNGQNIQLCYNYQYDAWVICSKNTSLLAKSREDLKMYKQSRYNYVLLVAGQWFKQIQNLSKDQIRDLKKLLDGFTAVGSYCGDQQYQYLITYKQVGIRWFALVDNFSQQFCQNPMTAKKQFQKFGFRFAKVSSIIFTSSPESFYESMYKIYSKTAQSGIQDVEYGMEGSIVYFVVNQSSKNGIKKDYTVGAGQLKTLQYRYFKKIRQRVCNFISKKDRKQQLVKKYTKQIKDLSNQSQCRAPYPHQFYIKILNNLLDLVQIMNLEEDKLRTNFIPLLKMIFYCLNRCMSFKNYAKSMLNDSSFMQKVSQIPFSTYNGLGCSTRIIYIVLCLAGMFKSYLANQISSHFSKINVNYNIIEIKNCENLQKDISLLYQPQKSPLQHYFIDGSLDSESIFNIIKYTHKNSDGNSFYKFILVKDSDKNLFTCSDGNQYPFTLETIIMCYYGQHRYMINSARLQPKIDNLKIVTQKLRKNANFNRIISRLNIQEYHHPFSQSSKFENVQEFSKIIKDILKVNDQKTEFNLYAMLILRLQKIQNLQYLSESRTDNEVKNLIKASYPTIPVINFKK